MTRAATEGRGGSHRLGSSDTRSGPHPGRLVSVTPYAITATSVACALGRTAEDALPALHAGRSGLVPVGAELGLPFTTWFGAVPGTLDPLPAPLARFDTRHARLVAHVLAGVRDALDDAKARWGAHRIGIALGTTTGGVGDTESRWPTFRDTGALPADYDIRTHHNLHATADVVAALAGLTGPRLVQSSACSSSSKVFGTARRWLDLGVCDAVLCGGIDSRCRFTLLGFHALGILSADRCRPFGAERDGINLGEAGGMVLVERDGDALAWLRGVGETSDAHHMTQPEPQGAGVRAAIQMALEQAGLPADAVDLVNAHATGTPLNDAAEAASLAATLPHRPLVTATKAYTGHTLGACGGLEVAFLVDALQTGLAPATLTDGPFLPEGEALDLRAEPVVRPFRAALNVSAAFAGHNAAVLLEAP